MRRKIETFIQFEDEITWCWLEYDYDYYGMSRDLMREPEIFHLSVYSYASGDITEYVSEEWMKKLDELVKADIKAQEEREKELNNKTKDNNLLAFVALKCSYARYTEKQTIDELVRIGGDIYKKYHEAIALLPAAPIIISKEQYKNFKDQYDH